MSVIQCSQEKMNMAQLRKEYLENEKMKKNTFLLCKWDIIRQKKAEQETEFMRTLKQRRAMKALLIIKGLDEVIKGVYQKFNQKKT